MTVELLDEQRRAEGRRQVLFNAGVIAMLVVGFTGLAGYSAPSTQTMADPPVTNERVLEHRTAQQAKELAALRDLFIFCRTRSNWSDPSCVPPDTGSVLVAQAAKESSGSRVEVVRVTRHRVSEGSKGSGVPTSNSGGQSPTPTKTTGTTNPKPGHSRPGHTKPGGGHNKTGSGTNNTTGGVGNGKGHK